MMHEEDFVQGGLDLNRNPWERLLDVAIHTFHQHRKLILSIVASMFVFLLAGTLFFIHCAKLVNHELRGGPFRDAVNIYAGPIRISRGDTTSLDDLNSLLRLAGYSESSGAEPNTFHVSAKSLALVPPDASPQMPVLISFNDKQQIVRIQSEGHDVKTWDAGYPLLANLSSGREKRHLVTFAEIPPVLVHAVVAAEDKHFFQHSGVDLPRILKAAYVDLHSRRKEQGASTLTMQLVRGLWLQPEKRWHRKLEETMMTIYLEHKWSKEEIFETYANQVYLGEQAAYSIHGFAQGSQMFFGKELRDLTLPQAALLAGMIQRPSYFNPYRNRDRAIERRNLVLTLMRTNGAITDAEYQDAVDSTLHLASPNRRDDAFGAPYFLDRVNDELHKTDQPEGAIKAVYTTVDMSLQRAAREAIKSGMDEVDKLLAARYKKSPARAEAALIAIDPHTGEIKAMVGGRDYARSQFNRLLAIRPPGSVFKPFVYAAALDTALTGGDKIFTLASTVDDTPTTFYSGGKYYQPANFGHELFGTLTLRQALAKSDNIAAVKVAQAVGYNSVVAMARRAGLTGQIAATPSVALGSYGVTPLDIAGAYTTFANNGRRVKPQIISSLRNGANETIHQHVDQSSQAIDPRVAYLMVAMLQEVMNSGTAAGVRSRGFVLPAAGKTGTSHDGWFAGFTSELLCIVWVGFDDYRELNLEGAKSALPIWAEFMKKAVQIGAYRNVKPFAQPSGIISTRICSESGKLATDNCDRTRTEFFVMGTEPAEPCEMHSTPPSTPVADATSYQTAAVTDAAVPR